MARLLIAGILLVVPAPICGNLMALAGEKGGECKRGKNTTVGLKPACIGAPDQLNLLCPHEDASAKTVHVNAPVKIGFNNTSGEEVSLYWLDEAGKEQFQKTIAPSGVTSQDTFLGHVFRVKSKISGRTLLEHTVGLIPLRNDAKITDFPTDKRSHPNPKLERITHDKPTDGSFEVGFVNRAGGFLKLFFHKSDGHRELVMQLESRDVYPQVTYEGHEFRAYTGDDRLVTSIKVGSIVAPSCTDHHEVQHRNHVQKLIATAVGGLDVWDQVDRDRDAEYLDDDDNALECFSTYCALKPSRPRNVGFLNKKSGWSMPVV